MTVKEFMALDVKLGGGFSKIEYYCSFTALGDIMIRFVWRVPDIYTPGNPITPVIGHNIITHYMIEHLKTPRDAAELLLDLLIGLVKHEATEALTVNGKRACNPHPERKKRAA